MHVRGRIAQNLPGKPSFSTYPRCVYTKNGPRGPLFKISIIPTSITSARLLSCHRMRPGAAQGCFAAVAEHDADFSSTPPQDLHEKIFGKPRAGLQHRARCLNSAILLSLCSMWWRMLSENACVFKLYTPHTPHLHAPGRMGQREAAAATARLWLRVRTATLRVLGSY